MYHLGPERDHGFFEGLSVRFVPAQDATVVVCTGLFDDENEKPEDYDEMLRAFLRRDVLMICANPDLVVERGEKLLPCAGALAERYTAMGGSVIQAGKPFRPIYDLAFEKIQQNVEPGEILAIGDGVHTDIKGAAQLGIDAIYIASHVNLASGTKSQTLTSKTLQTLFNKLPFRPVAGMSQLSW
jgi:HAD superfamily hydrolase (TIGR01459 family)